MSTCLRRTTLLPSTTCCFETACAPTHKTGPFTSAPTADLALRDWSDMNANADAKTEIIEGIKARARAERDDKK